ncbi:MAG: hypothetical protein NTW49_00635 [Bacteroidia bacterium]|nr:hypothetical protein [Bacteroidia bacterium]
MKKIIEITILLIIFVLMYSCCKENTYKYVNSKFILPYHKGDTLIYKDNNNIKDTFFINKIRINYNKYSNEDYCNTYQYHEIIDYYMDSLYNPANYGQNYIEVREGGTIEIYWYNDLFSTEYKSNYYIIDSIYLNGISYFNVYSFNNYIGIGFKSNKINRIYYQPNIGIICYYTIDGDIWNIIKY